MPKHEMPEFQCVWGFRRYVPYMNCKKNLQPGCKKIYGFGLQNLLFQQGLVVDTVFINFIFHCLPGQLEYGRCF